MANLTLSDALVKQLHQHADQRGISVEALISDLLEQDKQPVSPKIYQDIVVQHDAQYKLRYQSAVIKAISDAVIILDTDFNIISWNHQAEQMYGWTEAEVSGRKLYDVLPLKFTDSANQDVLKTFLATGSWRGEVIQTTKDGRDLSVLVSVSMVYDENQEAIAYVGVHWDITARNRAAELEASQRALGMQLQKEQEITRLRSQMLRIVAHEFRTPLATILSSVELLVTYGDRLCETSRMRHRDKINRQVTILDQFIEEMRLFAHGEYQMFMGKTEKVELPTFLHNLVDDIQPILKENQVLKANIPNNLPIIECNPPLFRLAISNLLSNAIKYSPTNSTINFSVTQVNNTIEFIIKDEGIGIPAADRKYLFEPFKRASNSVDYHGNGIGLSIVKEAIERHDGTIRYESEVGIGTTFKIDIPVNVAKAPHQAI